MVGGGWYGSVVVGSGCWGRARPLIKPPSRYPRSQVPGSKRGRGPGPSSKKAIIPGPRVQKGSGPRSQIFKNPRFSKIQDFLKNPGPGPSSKKAIIPGPRTQKGSGPRSQDTLRYLEGGLIIKNQTHRRKHDIQTLPNLVSDWAGGSL